VRRKNNEKFTPKVAYSPALVLKYIDAEKVKRSP